MFWHSFEKKEVLKELNSDEDGITEQEASLRLEKFGKNEIKETSRISPVLIFLEQFKSVFIIILLAAAAFSFIIGHYIDFSVIIAIVILNSTVGFFQQYKAEKIIKQMKKLLVPNVKVLRNNIMAEIPSTQLVPGDVIIVSEGDKIMADCRILYSNDLEANEAVLTGESFPQNKTSGTLPVDTEMADMENMLFMGTTIVRGNARAVVVETGMDTEFGRIANLVQKQKIEKTPLEKKLDQFSMRIAALVIFLAAVTIGIGVLQGKDLFNMILTGTALAIAVIPEGIPAVIAITLALAIKRMHSHNALIRKLPSAETLGRTTVICTDKTGTLTEEEMTVTSLFCGNSYFSIKSNNFFSDNRKIVPMKIKDLAQLLRIGILCNNSRLEGEKIFGDPTEKALLVSAINANLIKKIETEKEKRIIEYSFSSTRKLMSIVRENEQLISYVKGAPDIVLRRCSKELVNGRAVQMTERRREELHAVYGSMAANALRVLAFAYRPIKEVSQENAESDLIFTGFQGMLDPPRKEVKQAIRDCINAGIKVKMITGDSLITANAIGKIIGLDGGSIESRELEKMSEEDFDECVMQRTIFARMTPELKLKIIKSLKKQDEIVAVTGDGVNDVLALKEADIGIAMGKRGTDVAREVSDIILLDDNFSSIVSAVREGRRVYDNMKKSIKFHLAANFGELLTVLLALLFFLPLPLLPLAILWMNLITDSLPSIALSVENEEEDIMKRKPKDHDETILNGISSFILFAGLIAFLSIIIVFLMYQNDLDKARTMALTTAVFSEMFLIFTCRSDKNVWKIGVFSNKLLVYSVLAAISLQMIAVYSPLASVFEFKALGLAELAVCIAFSSWAFLFFETKKFMEFQRAKNP